MNKKELLKALESIGMRPGRGLGQNFLIDDNLLESIVRLSNPQEGEKILEVGPGFGALTKKLLASKVNLYSIEFDHRIAEYLRKNVQADNFHLIEDDACRVNYKDLLGDEPFRAIANLPYSISTIFIAKMLELSEPPEEMYFMLQKEMGQRLSASYGNKSYGAISVRTQLLYDVKIEKTVPPEVFFPQPEIDSAIVSFKRHHKYDNNKDLLRLTTGVAKNTFAQRRKQLGKVLSQNYTKEKAYFALEQMDLSPETRPDKLSPEKFLELTKFLFSDRF